MAPPVEARAGFPVEADFLEDVRSQMINLLRRSGFNVDRTTAVARTCELYFNACRRHIEPRPRRAHISRELSARRLSLMERRGLKAVERLSESGGNLNPFLSKRIKDLEYNDLLLNDWGIHHMHLDVDSPGKGGFVHRSGPLLFARVEADDLYLIDVLGHEPRTNFANDSLLRTLHANWPQILEPRRLVGVRVPTDLFTPDERLTLRRKRLSVADAIGDAVFLPLGGGSVSSGLSLEVRIRADRLLNAARSLELQCREHAARIAPAI
ncbi:MAG TPA: hypothetical protein VEA99_00855, partial [Gemmatimonadaceae bacterium]|nr:hypothetical protein [Gemmatimonadaceae bacterium]